MRIMWIVNTIFPYPSKILNLPQNVFGGWLLGLFNELEKNTQIELCIVTTYKEKQLKKIVNQGTTYYLIPMKNNLKYDKSTIKYWKEITKDFKPDLVHIHGSEFPFGLMYHNACPEIKKVLSIQGLISIYAEKYTADIPFKDIIYNTTIRDIIRGNICVEKLQYQNRGKYEIKLIKNLKYVIGRTKWDYASCKNINPNIKYFSCNESLRESFYKKAWNINNIERNSIFISQASYPIKGFHFLIKALPELKNKYPNIKVYVAGENILKNNFRKKGYAKYLMKLIKKCNLEENIIMLGFLNEKEVVNQLLKSHVFVQSSIIENSPNSLGEAMLLGLPCVASNVGGTNSLIENEKEGFLYEYNEIESLINYICEIFESDDLAIKLGKNARTRALKTHDRNANCQNMIDIYKEILNEK